MNRWSISLMQLRRDMVNEQYRQKQKQEQEQEQEQETATAIAIMTDYAEPLNLE